jgi:signal transduction histidine kinase
VAFFPFPLARSAALRRSGRSSTPVLLGASLGLVALTTVLAFIAAWSARANTRQLLRDYAAFAAWSYKQHLGNDLEEAAWLTLGPINHREPHHSSKTPTAADLPHYREMNLAECHCDPPAHPATYYRFPLGSDTLTTAGTPAAPGLSSALPRVIRTLIRSDSTLPRIGIIRVPDRPEVVAYGLMPTEWGDTIVYGFTFDSLSLIAGFDSVLQRASLLPTAVTHGHPNHELLGLEVRNTAGELLHRSPGWPVDEKEWPYIAAESLPPLRGGFVARLTLNPASAPALLAGGLPKTPLAVLVAIGVLGVMAALVALAQLRREGELSRLRTGFVAGVSHELRTPLAQMRLFLDTLRLKRYDTEVEREWLMGHLTRETTRLEHLVENVLAVSRLDRGVISEAPLEPLDLGREVDEAVSAFAPLAASRQVELSVELQEGVGVLADQAALRQLLLNLLDNAVKFGPPGQVVRLRVARRNGSAALTISDQGPGVGEEDRERIWEPYYRGSNSATRAVGGSGIGLAIVREVATRFGGSVSVQTPAGGGAEFTVSFPTLGERSGDA